MALGVSSLRSFRRFARPRSCSEANSMAELRMRSVRTTLASYPGRVGGLGTRLELPHRPTHRIVRVP